MSTNRTVKQRARELMRTEGIKYTEALRRVIVAGTATEQPTRVAVNGPCDLRTRHEGHLVDLATSDNAGNRLFQQCPGQYTDCANCDDVQCMSCVLREVHDRCEKDCPDCCGREDDVTADDTACSVRCEQGRLRPGRPGTALPPADRAGMLHRAAPAGDVVKHDGKRS